MPSTWDVTARDLCQIERARAESLLRASEVRDRNEIHSTQPEANDAEVGMLIWDAGSTGQQEGGLHGDWPSLLQS